MKLYANIGVGHENDLDVLKQRIISAAQCNADAVVIGKSTPVKTIPKNENILISSVIAISVNNTNIIEVV